MAGIYWEIDESAPLTVQLRALLLTRYGYTAPVEHTHALLVSVRESMPGRDIVLVGFATSFRAQDWTGNATGLEAQISADCVARLTAIKNALPLSSIVSRRHWL